MSFTILLFDAHADAQPQQHAKADTGGEINDSGAPEGHTRAHPNTHAVCHVISVGFIILVPLALFVRLLFVVVDHQQRNADAKHGPRQRRR